MFERDYLMNLLMQFFRGMMRANELRQKKDDPNLASKMLEDLIQESLDMDGAAILQLSPDSIAQVMRVMGVDPHMMEFISRSLLLDAVYLTDDGQDQMAEMRREQAFAIAREYGFELPENLSDFEGITEGLYEEDSDAELTEDADADSTEEFESGLADEHPDAH